ncbi:DUF4160 domain-containing protein [Oligoflexus tunisiensis]|uniref:DUF4160 domain-containing protein n=1 Tax=Oligoflexus tunisiensis TaxID=708132 RepID=UPI00114CDBCB
MHIWSRDHRPVHCHVTVTNESEYRIFLPDLSFEYVEGKPLTSSELKQIQQIVWDHRYPIGREWRRLHGN